MAYADGVRLGVGFAVASLSALAACAGAANEVRAPSVEPLVATTHGPTRWSVLAVPTLSRDSSDSRTIAVRDGRVCLLNHGLRACVGADESVELAEVVLDEEAQFLGCVGDTCLFVDVSRALVLRSDGYLGEPVSVADSLETDLRVTMPGSAVPVLLGANGHAWRWRKRGLEQLPIAGRILDATFADDRFGLARVGPEDTLYETYDGGRTFTRRNDFEGHAGEFQREPGGVFVVTQLGRCPSSEGLDERPQCAPDVGITIDSEGRAIPGERPAHDAPDAPLDAAVALALVRSALLDRLGFGSDFVLPASDEFQDPVSVLLTSRMCEMHGGPCDDLFNGPRTISRANGYVTAYSDVTVYGTHGDRIATSEERVGGMAVFDSTTTSFLVIEEPEGPEDGPCRASWVRPDGTTELELPSDVVSAEVLALVGDELVVGGTQCGSDLCGDAPFVAIGLDEPNTRRVIRVAGLEPLDHVAARTHFVRDGGSSAVADHVTSDGTFYAVVGRGDARRLVIGPVTGPMQSYELPPGIVGVAFLDARRGIARSTRAPGILATDDGGASFRPLDVGVGELELDGYGRGRALEERSHAVSDRFDPWFEFELGESDQEIDDVSAQEEALALDLVCTRDACNVNGRILFPDDDSGRARLLRSLASPLPARFRAYYRGDADTTGVWTGYTLRAPPLEARARAQWTDPNRPRRESDPIDSHTGRGLVEIRRDDAHTDHGRISVEAVDISGARTTFVSRSMTLDPEDPPPRLVIASPALAILRFAHGAHDGIRVLLRDGRVIRPAGDDVPERWVVADVLPDGGVVWLVKDHPWLRVVRMDPTGRVTFTPRLEFVTGVVLVHRGNESSGARVDPQTGAIEVLLPTGTETVSANWGDVRPCETPADASSFEIVGGFPRREGDRWSTYEPGRVHLALVAGRICLRAWSREPSPSVDVREVLYARPHADGSIGYRVSASGIAALERATDSGRVVESRHVFSTWIGAHQGTVSLAFSVATSDATSRTTIVRRTLGSEVVADSIDGLAWRVPFAETPRRLADGSWTEFGTTVPGNVARAACVDPDPNRVLLERVASPTRSLVADVRNDEVAIETDGARSVLDPLGNVLDLATLAGGEDYSVAIAHVLGELSGSGDTRVAETTLLTLRHDGSYHRATLDRVGVSNDVLPVIAVAPSEAGPLVAVSDWGTRSIRILGRHGRTLVDAVSSVAVAGEVVTALLGFQTNPLRVAYVDTPIGSTRVAIRIVERRDDHWVEVTPPRDLVSDPRATFVPAGAYVGDALYVLVPNGHDGYEVARFEDGRWEIVLSESFANVPTPSEVPLCETEEDESDVVEE